MEKILFTDLEHVKTIKGLAIYLTDHFQKEFVLDGEEHYLKLGVKKHEDSVPKYFIEFGYFGFELLPDVIDKDIASYLQEVIEFITVSNRDDWFKKPRYYLVIMRGQDGNCMYLSKSSVSGEDFGIGYGNEESICTHEENQFTTGMKENNPEFQFNTNNQRSVKVANVVVDYIQHTVLTYLLNNDREYNVNIRKLWGGKQ